MNDSQKQVLQANTSHKTQYPGVQLCVTIVRMTDLILLDHLAFIIKHEHYF